MHQLHEKRGKKVVTHYFSHVKESDGTKRHVYLGTHPEKSKERLVKLRAARVSSDNPLVKELDDAKSRLDMLAHYNRPYDDILSDVRERYAKQQHAERIVSSQHSIPAYKYLLVIIAATLFGTGLFYVLSEPSITGAAVEAFDFAASNKIISASFFMILAVVVLGIAVYAAQYRHEHRYDKYKPR
jgi:hypothetical protein